MDTETRVFGIIGDPIGHTLSPVIHGAFGRMTGRKLVYAPFHVKKGSAGDALEAAYTLGIQGMNVTVPHKSDVIPRLSGIDPLAEKIGAVNTLVRTDGGFKGYNTDVTGLGRAMKRAGITLRDSCAVILGAGGAGRAAAFLAVTEGARDTVIINRTSGRAEALAAEIRETTGSGSVRAAGFDEFMRETEGGHEDSGERVAIQCTSVGLAPHSDACVVSDDTFFRRISAAVDIVYRPLETAFLKRAAANGVRVLGGLYMLLYQAVDAFSLWYPDAQIPDEMADEVYDLLLKELENE